MFVILIRIARSFALIHVDFYFFVESLLFLSLSLTRFHLNGIKLKRFMT